MPNMSRTERSEEKNEDKKDGTASSGGSLN